MHFWLEGFNLQGVFPIVSVSCSSSVCRSSSSLKQPVVIIVTGVHCTLAIRSMHHAMPAAAARKGCCELLLAVLIEGQGLSPCLVLWQQLGYQCFSVACCVGTIYA